jgi:hypothetical protein
MKTSNTSNTTIKAIKRASREMNKDMPRGGRHKSKRDKARERNEKHPKRAKEEW